MPIGGNAQVTINVGARLQVLQSSVNEIQKVLDKLEPNSAGFKNLNTILQNARREMERLQVQTSKPFGSKEQLRQTEKTLGKIEEYISRAGIAVDKISFKDLKLTPDQIASFQKLKDSVKEAAKELEAAKESAKQELFSNQGDKNIILGIDPALETKSFDEIERRITREVDNLKRRLLSARKELEAAEGTKGNTGADVNKILSGDLSRDALGANLFDKFFQTTKNGVTKFNTTDFAKGEVKKQFLAALAQEFNLDEKDFEPLVNLTYNEMLQAFSQMGKGQSNNIFEDFLKKQQSKIDAAKESIAVNTALLQDAESVSGKINSYSALDEEGKAVGSVAQAEEHLNEVRANGRQILRDAEAETLRTALAHENVKEAVEGSKVALGQLDDELSRATTELMRQQQQLQTFQSIKSAIVNFMGFNQVLNITRNAVRAAINHIKELDTTMNGIAIVTDMTTADLWKQVDAYSAMAQNFGVTIQGAYEVSKIYYQAGYETNDVLTLTNETLKLSKISGLDYATTTDYMMTAMRGFKLEMEDASRVVDVYSNLAANTAVSQQELAEAMTRTASSMESVGATFEETSAMIATMVAVTRESANNIGSAMKSIASRYGELTKDPAALLDAEGEAMSFNKVDTALKSVGITLQTTDHQFRDFTDVIIELAEKWDTLDSAQQRYIATQFAGNRQQSRFLALVSNIDLLRENIANAENSEDVGTLQALKAMDSLESKINQVQVAYQQFYTTIGIESAWKGFLDGAKNVIDTLNSLPKVFGKIPAAAIILIMNAIQLIKNALLSGVAVIAKTIKSSLNETETEIEKTAQDAQKQGKTWAENLAIGFETGAKKLKSTVTSVIDGLKPIQKAPERKYTSEQGAFFNNWDSSVAALNVKSKGGKFSSANSPEWKQAFNELLEQLNAVGLGFDTSKMNAEKLREKLQELSPAVHKLAEEYNNTEKKIKEYDAYQKQHQQNVLKAANIFSEFGTGLSSLSLLFNDGSAAGKTFSGVMMILGGALTAVAAGMKAVQGASGWIGLAFTAITTIVSGISLAWETSEEKIERLNKEAEELNNKAKEAKANYNTLQRSVDKLDELEKKRYESAQAAEEYQTAVDELASSYPELINGINELGEITIDTASADRILADARKKAAEATIAAAKAESKSLEAQIEDKKDKIELDQQSYVNQGISLISNDDRDALALVDKNQSNIEEQIDKIVSKYEDTNFRESYKEYLLAYLQAFNDNSIESLENFQKVADSFLGKYWEQLGFLEKQDSSFFDQKALGNLYQLYDNLKSLNDALRGQTKIDFLGNIDKQNADNKLVSEALKSKGLRAFIAQDVYDDWQTNFANLTLEEYEEQSQRLQDADNEWYEWYSKLSDESQELLDKLFSETDKYSAEEIIQALGINDQDFQDVIINYYSENIKYYREKIKNVLDNMSLFYNSEFLERDFTKQDLNYWGKVGIEYERMMKSGLQSQANYFRNAALPLFEALDEYAKKNAVAAVQLKQEIIDNGISTKEGLQSTIDTISNDTSVPQEVKDGLEDLKNWLIENIALSVQSAFSSAGKSLDDSISDLNKLRSGMSFEEVINFLDKIKTLGITGIDINSFIDKNGKLVLTEKAFDSYWTQFKDKNSIISEEWTKLYETLTDKDSRAYGYTGEGFSQDALETALEETPNDLLAFAEKIGAKINVDENGKILDDADTINTKLTEAAKNYIELYETLSIIIKRGNENTQKSLDRAKGIYKDYITDQDYSTEELKQIATNVSLAADEEDKRAIKKNLNDVYSSLISDVLSKGFENVNLADYEGLIGGGKDIVFTSYEAFVKDYASFAGKTVEEINSLIVQAIEKDTAATSGAAKEALAHVDFYGKNKAFASKDTIKKLADAIGVTMNQMLGDYNAELDQYEVRNIEGWAAQITGSTEMFFDSINSVINSLTKYINSSLDGKLQRKDVTNLNAQLEAFGVDKLSEADFSETAEGLKISEQAAIRLYSELKNIDAIQSHITFNDLSKSLQDSNEHYKSVSSILAHIKELNEKINNLSPGDARRKEYERELAVAKEIAATRALTDEKSFKFMDNNLPSALQNPIDYVDAIGKMFKSMNTSAKEGYMGVQDFYNMVNELNNLAALGGPIEFMGRTLDGSLESAADLIQRGFHAISNIEGEGAKVDLSKFSIDFANGADDMAKNVESGIHAMAESQIKMLDAMIQFLETVVAMEQLGDIDDEGNGLDFEDMFDKTEEGLYKATEKMDGVVENIQKLASENPVLKDALDKIKVNGQSITNIFDQLSKGVKVDENHAQAYFTMFSALYKMAKDGNYDLENLVQSIQQIAATSGLLGEIEINDVKLDFRYGKTGTYDKNNAKWTYNGKSYDTRQKMYEDMAKDALGTDNITQVGDKYTKQIGNVTATVDLGGKITYTYNGLSSDSLTGLLDQVVEKDEKISSRAEAAAKLGVKVEYEASQNEEEKTIAAHETGAQIVENSIVEAFKQGSSIFKEMILAALGLKQSETTANNSPTNGKQAELDAQHAGEQAAYGKAFTDYQKKQAEAQNQQEIDALQNENAQLRKDKEDLLVQNSELQEQTSIYQNGNRIYLAEILEAEQANAKLHEDITNLNEQIKTLEEQKGKLETEIAELETANSAQLEEYDKILKSKDELYNQINILQDQLNGAKRTAEEKQRLLDQAKATYDSNLEAANAEKEISENKLAEAIEANQANSAQHAAELENAKAEQDKLQAELNAVKAEITDLTAQITEKDDEIKKLEADKKDLENEFASSAAVVNAELENVKAEAAAQLEVAKADVTAQLEAMKADKKRIEEELARTKEALADIQAKVESNIPYIMDQNNSNYIDFGSEPDEDTEGFFDTISTEIKNALSEIENWKAILQQRASRAPSPSETIDPTKSLYGEEPNKGVTGEEDNKVILEKVEEATETQANNTQEQTTAIKEQSDSIDTSIAKLQEYLDSNREQYENTKDYTEYSIEDLNFIDEYKSHLEEYNKLLAILQEQIKDNGDTTSNSNEAIKKNTAAQEENNKSAEDTADGQKELAGAQDDAADSAKDETAAQSGLASATRDASGGVSGLGSSIQELSSAASTAATTIAAAAKAAGEAAEQAYQAAQEAGNVSSDSPPSVIGPKRDSIYHKVPSNSQGGRAKGNVALAGGTRSTLMGELGPELYVTNGHYYVAGQNGAEFVDLPSDAIVFNHLQTERLLKNGSAGRGHTVTNEHKATSLATGNASGPAMASASAALAELKKIRAMWDAMSKASISDLGSKAGLGKKAGGGGSKDKGQVVKLDSGYIRDLERWYNLLRQIDRLEQDINYEEKLRSKLQADTVANGELIYESQRRTYEMLQRELDDRVELASLKKGYYEQRMAEIQAGPWGQLFYFNEEGVPQMKNLQFLADVFASSDEGGAVHNAREQYAMLQQAGFGSLLQYKEDGSIIEWTDDEGKPREEAYKEAVEAFSAKLDAQTEEVNGLREDYIEEMGNILDLQTKQNEILTQIRENTIAVEQEVLKAIEDFREREIDELQKQRDALSDSADKFIDGLTDSLNKEREMYNSQQEDTELLQMRRQLAILQRSGGSASQIRSLQEQIRQREQEAYFEEQENQINAIKEASDLQLERLDAQISLMQETLEYQKAHGLLWDQVHEIMQGTHEEITQFVTGNNSEWWAKSATQAQNDLVELDNKIGQWVAHRDDISTLGETMKNAINNGIAAITSVVAKVSESQSYTVSGTGSYVLPSSSGNGDTGSYSGGTPSTASNKKSRAKSVTPSVSGWQSDNTYHWRVQTNSNGSTTIIDKGRHNKDRKIDTGGTWTCYCSVCGHYMGIEYKPSSNKTTTNNKNTTKSGGCFVAGSKVIMANGIKKNIEEIKIGEEVIAYNDKENKFEPKKVVKAYAHYNTPRVLKITLSNGIVLGITPGHPILTTEGWKSRDIENSLYEHGVQAEWLEIGDEVLGYSGNAVVTSIEEKNIPNNYITYNIEVETCHTYLVDGLVVHNAKVAAYAEGGLIDYTGPAWVDGTKKKPEGILNAEQLDMLRNSVLTRKNPVAALLADYGNTVSNTANASTYNTINRGESMSIGNVELNMNVARIANDYDARRAGEKALEQMVKIAQKNGVNNIKRR